MFSARMQPEWFDLVEILKAKNPGKTVGAVLTATLKRGMENEDEAELNATVYQHPTLEGAEYLRLRKDYASIHKCLKSFRADLLQIDQYPDDEKRTENLAQLYKLTEDALRASITMNTRLARIALLPDVLQGDDFDTLLELKLILNRLKRDASTKDETAIYTLALKLIAPFFP